MKLTAISACVATLFAGVATANTCAVIEDVAPSVEVRYKLHPDYTSTSNDYWSTACAKLDPSCVVYPESPHDVAAILKVLGRQNNTDRFAIKSGGHNPNVEWSSVDEGPLISTEKLDQVILDEESGIVRIGPGLRWDAVADALDGSGWSVVGGRIGNVGVGGYMLGGGLSFMSQQYGWAASSLIEVELVTPNGTIVTASADEHPDLFRALKGGGNNFGVVTSYTVQSYRQDDIYGGTVFFPRKSDTDELMLQAIQDFTRYNKDDKAAIIPTAEYTGAGILDGWIVFFFYNGAEPPEGTFTNFTAIPHLTDTRKTQSFASLVNANNFFVIRGSVYLIGTETIPLPTDPESDMASEFLPQVHEHWRNVTLGEQLVSGVIGSIAYQPFPRRIAQLARAMGGDLIDFDNDVDRIVIELNYSFFLQLDYERMSAAMEAAFGGIREIVLAGQEEGALPDAYLPLFSNDAFHTQDYYGRLRPENAELAKTLADELDPQGLFKERTGGWKP
ncbi:uncharacterized protein F5Z01DRAFT_654794 [Emericellopsis atlantica]|uniref:FAD-binding PCMH-type domain-containing protein n=1 Tax=Emericellopsis atlantica TaxID=2614577 RepID=A0A9P7ZN67_9HYPO|nr:uncharacterized protein F5Z01DRAFT_654794 [Emericellopsis atlantica]KAG9254766.1 hypothetical protein F5Z01DRAFT_654794 [Emericellopsis atlantica]